MDCDRWGNFSANIDNFNQLCNYWPISKEVQCIVHRIFREKTYEISNVYRRNIILGGASEVLISTSAKFN